MHACLSIVPLSSPLVCCAEFNAIVSAFRYHADLTNSTLYTTGVPCPKCALMIVQSGIKTVVYFAGGMEVKVSEDMKKCAKEIEKDAEIVQNDADKMSDMTQGQAAIIMEKTAKIIAKNVEIFSNEMEGFVVVLNKNAKKMREEAEKMREEAEEEAEEKKRKAQKMKEEAEEKKRKAQKMKEKADELKKKVRVMKRIARKEANEIEKKAEEMKEDAEAIMACRYLPFMMKKVVKDLKAHANTIKVKGRDIDTMMEGIMEKRGEKEMEEEAKKIFYWAKVATL